MKKQSFPHDATPDVHDFSAPPENVRELVNMYGTYNIQPTANTDNVFPLIAPGLPRRWRGMKLDKPAIEKMDDPSAN